MVRGAGEMERSWWISISWARWLRGCEAVKADPQASDVADGAASQATPEGKQVCGWGV